MSERKTYIPTGGGFTAAEVCVLARILGEHGNPHGIPAIDSLGAKAETMKRWQNDDRERQYGGGGWIGEETAEAREARLIAYAQEHPLVNKPCDCDKDTGFRCYPEDGQCPCGCWKHHVHNTCGHIVQWG